MVIYIVYDPLLTAVGSLQLFILSVMDPQQTLPTSLWHLTKIFTFQTSSLECQVYLASITYQNMRKSKLLSWLVNAEYILYNDRNNTIGLNRQYTQAYFKKLNTNQFFDLHNPLQTPSMRWNKLLRLPWGVGKMGCVRRHIWAWAGSFSMQKAGISSEAPHITRSGARVLLSVLVVFVHNPLFLVYTKTLPFHPWVLELSKCQW